MEINKKDKYIGLEFYDNKMDKMKVLTYSEQFQGYLLCRNGVMNGMYNIEKSEDIEFYLSKQEKWINSYNKQLKEQEQEQKLKLQKQKEYEFCYGFVKFKTKLQQGKILKILNKKILFNDEFLTRKNLIHKLIKNNKNIYTKKFFNTNRYSRKKICSEYKNLKDKKEYELYYSNSLDDERFINLTKTEYNYCNYLINNKIKIQ